MSSDFLLRSFTFLLMYFIERVSNISNDLSFLTVKSNYMQSILYPCVRMSGERTKTIQKVSDFVINSIKGVSVLKTGGSELDNE